MSDSESEGFTLGQLWERTDILIKAVARIETQMGQLREDVAGLKVVARVWGAVAGIVGGGVVTLLLMALGWMVGWAK